MENSAKLKVGEEIKEIIAEIVEMEVDELDSDASFVDDLGLDSLRALEVLAALEKQYKIEIPESYMAELTSVNKAVEITLSIIENNQA